MQDLALYPQELLLIYPIIRYYAETELSKEPALAREIASLVALCRELDMVQSCKFGAPMNVAEQQQAASQHLEKFCDAYGEEAVKPKHHYANHIPRNDIRTLDCFLHERENKNVRAIASSIQNTDIYEASVLVRVTAEKMRRLEDKDVFALNAVLGPGQQTSVGTVARDCRAGGQHIAVNDVVFVDGLAVIVEACLQNAAGLYLLVRGLDKIGRVRGCSGASKWRPGPGQPSGFVALDGTHCFRHAHAWAEDGDGLLVLHSSTLL